MHAPLQGILWDLDGTLAGTKHLKHLAHQASIVQLDGRWLMSDHDYRALVSTTTRQAVKTITTSCGFTFPFEDYMRIWRRQYTLLLDTVTLHPGARQVLQQLNRDGINQSIVSSSSRHDVELVLKRTGAIRLMSGLISGDDVSNRKPHPEPYLLGLAQMELPAANVIAVEDTDTGIASAKAAGLRVVGIRHELNGRQTLSADCLIQAGKFNDTRWFIRQLALAL